MRILILNWWDIKNPRAGGAETLLFEIFSRLSKRGHQVTLLCTKFPGCQKEEEINGILVKRRVGKRLINLYSFFFYLKNRKNFDLVVDFTNKIPYLTPLFVRKKPIIAVALHLFDHTWEIEWWIFGRIFSKLEKWFFRRYKNTHFIAISESTKKELSNLGMSSNRIRVVYPGASSPTISSVKKSKNPLIISLGRLKKYKRIDWLLDAVQNIQKSIPGISLIVIGDGSDKRRLKEITKKLKLESVVTFTGFISDQEKFTWLKKAWVNVQPSIKEGWGLTVIEAATCGTPTVAADVSGLRESVIDGKTGWLFRNKKQLRELLTEVVMNRKKIEKAGREARKFAQNFSWDKASREVEKEIQRALTMKD